MRCVSLSDLNPGAVYRTRSGYAVVVINNEWTTVHLGCDDHHGYVVKYLDNSNQDVIPRCQVSLALLGNHEVDQFLRPDLPIISPEVEAKQLELREVLVKTDFDTPSED